MTNITNAIALAFTGILWLALACNGPSELTPIDAPASVDANSDARVDAPESDSQTTDAADVDAAIIDATAPDGSPDAAVDAAVPPLVVSVQIAATSGSNQVRQGAGAIRLLVAGSHLFPATALSLGEFAPVPAAGSTAEQLVLDVSIPHGVAVGARTLSITTPGGEDIFLNAIVVTEISAGPSGNDTTGRGTPDAPFRTATHAASESATGDIVQLADGIYSSLETWPLRNNANSTLSNIVLRGASTSNTILMGPGIDALYPAMYAQNSTIESLRISNFGTGIYTWLGDALLRALVIEACDSGILLSGTGNSEIRDTRVTARQIGVYMTSNSGANGGNIVMRNLIVRQSGSGHFIGVAVNYDGASGGSTTVEDSDIQTSGLSFGNGYAALSIQGSGVAAISVRRSHLGGPRAVAIVAGGLAVVDFGTPAYPGGNQLDCAYRCVSDSRQSRSAADGAIATFSGTRINGAFIEPSGLVVTGVAESMPSYEVTGANNRVSF